MSDRTETVPNSTDRTTNTRVSRRSYIAASGAAVASLAGCLGGGGGGGSSDQVTAAWVYDGEANDQGWVKAHHEGRKRIDEENDWLTTRYQESVGASESERVISDFAEVSDIVFTISAIYEDATASVAEEYPDTRFENAFGLKTAENLARYTLKTHEARYCLGVAAGLLTESNQLGFISGFELPQVYREANAFALGAQSVNPDATVDVSLVGSFIAPQECTSVVNSFASNGIDVVTAHMNTPATVSAAASNEIWGTGSFYNQMDAGGDWYVSALQPGWGNYYERRAEAVRDETWESQDFWAGMEEGVMGVGEFGPEVPQDVIDEARSAETAIGDGELNIWAGSKFEGENNEPGGFIETEMGSYVEGVSN